jgi:UDP-N-acetylmuramoyl-tripeptide--D-alanyl-D-alanine ligase
MTLMDLFLQNRKVSTDSRSLPGGSLYFAIKGERFDGNEFCQEALNRGAVIAVTDDPSNINKSGHFFVENSLVALQQLAKQFRESWDIPVIGITGSNGKTTTKELLISCLETSMDVSATRGNLNNHIGVPLTILSKPDSSEIAVIEMGANYPDEIAELASWAKPNIGIITSLGKAHLEGFGDFETIVRTKAGLFQQVMAQNGMLFCHSFDYKLLAKYIGEYASLVIINEDHFYIRDHIWHFEVISETPSIKFKLSNESLGVFESHSVLIGRYNFNNIILAISVGLYLGMDIENLLDGIQSYSPSNNRTQWITHGKHKILLDAYNANPTSMRSAIDAFATLPDPNKVLVLGGMKELGNHSHEEHSILLKQIQQYPWLKVLLLGTEYENLSYGPNVYFCSQKNQIVEVLNGLELPCNILVKGSRTYELEKLFQ